MIMQYAQQLSDILAASVVFIGTLLTISLAIPGDQPDKFLQKCLTALTKMSRKKK